MTSPNAAWMLERQIAMIDRLHEEANEQGHGRRGRSACDCVMCELLVEILNAALEPVRDVAGILPMLRAVYEWQGGRP